MRCMQILGAGRRDDVSFPHVLLIAVATPPGCWEDMGVGRGWTNEVESLGFLFFKPEPHDQTLWRRREASTTAVIKPIYEKLFFQVGRSSEETLVRSSCDLAGGNAGNHCQFSVSYYRGRCCVTEQFIVTRQPHFIQVQFLAAHFRR